VVPSGGLHQSRDINDLGRSGSIDPSTPSLRFPGEVSHQRADSHLPACAPINAHGGRGSPPPSAAALERIRASAGTSTSYGSFLQRVGVSIASVELPSGSLVRARCSRRPSTIAALLRLPEPEQRAAEAARLGLLPADIATIHSSTIPTLSSVIIAARMEIEPDDFVAGTMALRLCFEPERSHGQSMRRWDTAQQRQPKRNGLQFRPRLPW